MKNRHLKQAYILFSSLMLFLIHLPISFAKSLNPQETKLSSGNIDSCSIYHSACGLYDSLKLNILGLSRSAYDLAVEGMEKLMAQGKIENTDLLSIIDFTKPSPEKRLFVIDILHGRLLFNTNVAHGRGSGGTYASVFSNIRSSYSSSLGFYETAGTYMGKHGYSLKLEGLEKDFNDQANQRSIVMHSAPYLSETYIRARGVPGRSLGCPVLPESLCRPIIEAIKGGTCLFIYGYDQRYLRYSPVLNG